jgi:hypothetical protein
MALSPTPPQNPKKNKNAYPDPSIYLAPNCATTSFRKTPPHKQVNLLLRFANPKASKKYERILFHSISPFSFLPILHNQNPF